MHSFICTRFISIAQKDKHTEVHAWNTQLYELTKEAYKKGQKNKQELQEETDVWENPPKKEHEEGSLSLPDRKKDKQADKKTYKKEHKKNKRLCRLGVGKKREKNKKENILVRINEIMYFFRTL